jgi:hypothetical protein
MDQALLVLIGIFVFAAGFGVGYIVRHGISRHRRAKAKRSRRFFDNDPVPEMTSLQPNFTPLTNKEPDIARGNMPTKLQKEFPKLKVG